MKKLIYIFILSTLLAKAQNPAPLFNVGKYTVTDYDLHYHCSGALTVFHSSVMYYTTERKWISIFTGIITSVAIGAAKEYIYDAKPSYMDLESDTKGSVYYGLITAASIDMMEKKKIKIDTLKYQNLNKK